MQVEAPCREAGAMLVLKTRGAVISEFSTDYTQLNVSFQIHYVA